MGASVFSIIHYKKVNKFEEKKGAFYLRKSTNFIELSTGVMYQRIVRTTLMKVIAK